MKLIAKEAFVYEGKDIMKGKKVNIKERDAVALLRRGLVEPEKKQEEKETASGENTEKPAAGAAKDTNK